MPQFSYKAVGVDKKIKYGKLLATDKGDLLRKLSKLGLTLLSSEEKSVQNKKAINQDINISKILKRVSVVDKMLFTRHLGVMLKAGLSFSRALTVLSEQTNNAYFKEILEGIKKDVQRGNSLAKSLEKHPKVFDGLFVNMIRVGEASGNLEEVLDILSLQLKKSHELTSKVKGAMMYPAVIVFAMVVIGVLMMIFVIPTLLNIFKDMEVELPATTKAIIFISDAFQNQGIFILLGVIILSALFSWTIKTAKGKKAFDCFLLRLPAIGKIISKINMARFSRTLSSMVSSGVSIVNALEIISGTLGNTYYKESVKSACAEMQKGVALSEVIGRYDKLYYPLMTHMIEVGEETGTLEDTLKQVAEFYEEEIDQITSNLSSIIEPVLMLVIGGAVGFFAVSMIQPMYGIMGEM
ncbi:MAG: type II secretion system F family protein [Patescibacteria group bacterium]|nr:type II secretion system F family protein [Patescibacteria group bacterium]